MNRFRLCRHLIILLITGVVYLVLAYSVNAEPPEPQSAFHWESNPDQTVTMFFFEKTGLVKYTYQLVHEAEPASECGNSFPPNKPYFTLLSISDLIPFRYTVHRKPILIQRWDDKTFIGLD